MGSNYDIFSHKDNHKGWNMAWCMECMAFIVLYMIWLRVSLNERVFVSSMLSGVLLIGYLKLRRIRTRHIPRVGRRIFKHDARVVLFCNVKIRLSNWILYLHEL